MTRHLRCFRIPVLLLMSVLLASPAGLLSALWQSVLKLVPSVAASRIGMDPDGQPIPTTTGEEGDSRYGMDPDGRT